MFKVGDEVKVLPFEIAIKRNRDGVYTQDNGSPRESVWAIRKYQWDEVFLNKKLTVRRVHIDQGNNIHINFYEIDIELPPDVLVYWKPMPKNFKGQLIGGSLA